MSDTLREIIFDTETTGLSAKDGDRVIEIGAVELVNRFPTGKTFHMFINPDGREVHPDALNIHGISNEFLSDKPKFSEIYKEFETFFSDGNLVAHNASFDMGFLNAELNRINKPMLSGKRVVDTLLIARKKFPGQRNSLDALCARFGVDNSHREKHGALLDSEILAEVYIELLGGKQAKLVLDHDTGEETKATQSGSEDNNFTPIAKRPSKLPSRLTREDIKRHADFIDTLGDNALWKKLAGE